MDVESIFNELVKIDEKLVFTDEDVAFLIEHSANEDAENRGFIAELLINVKTEESKDTLLRLTTDESWIVRASAYDSLSVFDDEKVAEYLKERIKKEKRTTAKSYAIMSLGDILKRINRKTKQDISFLKENEEKEKSTGVKLACYYSLYLLGEKEYIHKIIKEMDNRMYTLRCACINTLMEIVDKENKDIIIDALEKRHFTEKVPAVLSGIKELIKKAKMI